MLNSSDKYKLISIYLQKEELFLFHFKIMIKFLKLNSMNRKKTIIFNHKRVLMMNKQRKKEKNFYKKDLIF